MQVTKLFAHRELASIKYFINHGGIKLFIERKGKTPFGMKRSKGG